MLRPKNENKRITAVDYQSQRLDYLHGLVIDGIDAEAVLKYAYKLREEADEQMHMTLLSNASDIEGMRNYYKIACRFCDMLESAARTGRDKQNVIEQLTRN